MNFALGWLLSVLLLTSAQSTLARLMSVYDVKPDFLLIFAAFAGIAVGRTHGMVVGFFCGLLSDLLNMGLFGFHTFLLFSAGLFAGMMRNKVFKDNSVFPIILIVFFSIVKEAAWMLTVFLGGYRLTDLTAFFSLGAMRILYNGIIAAPLFWLFNRVRKFVDR